MAGKPRIFPPLKRLVIFLVGSYLLVALLLTIFQRVVIYPGRISQGKDYAQFMPGVNETIIELQSEDGTRFVGCFRAIDDTARPTVVYYYGNGDRLANAHMMAMLFDGLGVNVLTIEYPGYGLSDGSPSERAFFATIKPTRAWLEQNPSVDMQNLFVLGQSIGTGTAAEFASRLDVRGVILIAPFTSLKDVAQRKLPIFPIRLMLRDHFQVLSKLSARDVPVLLIHGTSDTVVPYRHSQRIHQTIADRSTLITIEGSDHNDLFELGWEKIRDAVRTFVIANKTGSANGLDTP